MFARWHSAADRWPSAMSQFRSSTLRLRTAFTKLSKWCWSLPPLLRRNFDA